MLHVINIKPATIDSHCTLSQGQLYVYLPKNYEGKRYIATKNGNNITIIENPNGVKVLLPSTKGRSYLRIRKGVAGMGDGSSYKEPVTLTVIPNGFSFDIPKLTPKPVKHKQAKVAQETSRESCKDRLEEAIEFINTLAELCPLELRVENNKLQVYAEMTVLDEIS